MFASRAGAPVSSQMNVNGMKWTVVGVLALSALVLLTRFEHFDGTWKGTNTGALQKQNAVQREDSVKSDTSCSPAWTPSGGAISTFTHATLKAAISTKGCPRYVIQHGSSIDRFFRVYGCEVTSAAVTIDTFWGHEHAGRMNTILTLDSAGVWTLDHGYFSYNKAPTPLQPLVGWNEPTREIVFQTTVIANEHALDASPSQMINLMTQQKTCPTSVKVKSTNGGEIVLGMDTTCLVFDKATAPWPDLYFNRLFPNGVVGFLQIRGSASSSVTNVWVSAWDTNGELTSAVGAFTTGQTFDLNVWYPLGGAFHVVAEPASFAVTF